MFKMLACACAFVCSLAVSAQLVSKDFDKVLNKAAKDGFSGTVLLADSNFTLYSNSVGLANREDGTAFSPETRFRIGNITELFSLIPVLQLVEQGSLDLDLPLSMLMPELAVLNAEQIKLRHLITHTSGFADTDSLLTERLSPSEMIRTCLRDEAGSVPVGTYQYSKANYLILGNLTQKYFLKEWQYVIEDNILRKYGMYLSGDHEKGEIVAGLAKGYYSKDGEMEPENVVYFNNLHSAGNFFASASDLLILSEALHSGDYFAPEMLEGLQTPETLPSNEGLTEIARDYRLRRFQLEGFSGSFYKSDDRKTLIILANSNYDHSSLFATLQRMLEES